MFTNEASEIGLILTYLLMVSNSSSTLLFTASNIAKSAASIERIYEYATWNDHEKSFENPKPPKTWPSTGSIKCEKLSVRYRDHLPLVIDELSFEIKSG